MFKRISRAFKTACLSYANKCREKGYSYNSQSTMIVKLSLICLILFLIIIGLIVLCIVI